MTIQEKAIERAVQFLNAAGAQYRIVIGDTLVVDTFPAPRKPRTQVNDWVKLTDYVNKIKALKEGETLVFERTDYAEWEDNAKWNSFQASFNHAVKSHLGEDRYVYEAANGRAEVLRVS